MCNKKSLICQDLPWDSKFFNLAIGSISCSVDVAEQEIEKALAEFRSRGVDLVYLMFDAEKELDEGLCQRFGGQLVDVKYTYVKALDLKFEVSLNSSIHEYAASGDVLYELAYAAGWRSRFRVDKNFPQDVFENFYRTWVENSLHGGMADAVYVFDDGDALPKGFVTLKLKNRNASIGLIAVDSLCRGRGIGRALVDRCFVVAAQSGCESLTVATQKENIGARSFYESCGMDLMSVNSVYHFWLKK